MASSTRPEASNAGAVSSAPAIAAVAANSATTRNEKRNPSLISTHHLDRQMIMKWLGVRRATGHQRSFWQAARDLRLGQIGDGRLHGAPLQFIVHNLKD